IVAMAMSASLVSEGMKRTQAETNHTQRHLSADCGDNESPLLPREAEGYSRSSAEAGCPRYPPRRRTPLDVSRPKGRRASSPRNIRAQAARRARRQVARM